MFGLWVWWDLCGWVGLVWTTSCGNDTDRASQRIRRWRLPFKISVFCRVDLCDHADFICCICTLTGSLSLDVGKCCCNKVSFPKRVYSSIPNMNSDTCSSKLGGEFVRRMRMESGIRTTILRSPLWMLVGWWSRSSGVSKSWRYVIMNVENSMHETLRWVDGCLKLCILLAKSLMMMSGRPYQRRSSWRAALYIVLLQV